MSFRLTIGRVEAVTAHALAMIAKRAEGTAPAPEPEFTEEMRRLERAVIGARTDFGEGHSKSICSLLAEVLGLSAVQLSVVRKKLGITVTNPLYAFPGEMVVGLVKTNGHSYPLNEPLIARGTETSNKCLKFSTTIPVELVDGDHFNFGSGTPGTDWRYATAEEVAAWKAKALANIAANEDAEKTKPDALLVALKIA